MWDPHRDSIWRRNFWPLTKFVVSSCKNAEHLGINIKEGLHRFNKSLNHIFGILIYTFYNNVYLTMKSEYFKEAYIKTAYVVFFTSY